MNKKLRLGSRGSKLALIQADLAKKTINQYFPELDIDIFVIKTKGDKILDTALSKIGDKGLFTKELENSLLSKEIDIAVHSLKDLPSEIAPEFSLSAVLERANNCDALISKNGKKLSQLTSENVIATSSLRRIAGLRHLNPDFQIVDIRGNVQTRLKKMEDGYCDAMVLATAGLQRLNLDNYITEIIDPEILVPAVGQGAIALETKSSDNLIKQICTKINDTETWIRISAERAFMRKIEGGCQIPVGAYAIITGKKLFITGFIASLDGKKYLRETLTGSVNSPEELGQKLATVLINKGGKDILNKIRL